MRREMEHSPLILILATPFFCFLKAMPFAALKFIPVNDANYEVSFTRRHLSVSASYLFSTIHKLLGNPFNIFVVLQWIARQTCDLPWPFECIDTGVEFA
jgi:hypothetical protein